MDFDYSFYSFNTNLKIALVLPTLKYGPESDIDWAWIDTRALYRLAINQIITSLELYYESIFKIISGYIKISKIHPKSLVFFIKIYGRPFYYLLRLSSLNLFVFICLGHRHFFQVYVDSGIG